MIRFIDLMQRRLQLRWYRETYGKKIMSDVPLLPPVIDSSSFVRPTLPSAMRALPTPSVLPFHTVSYSFLRRTISLIYLSSSCILLTHALYVLFAIEMPCVHRIGLTRDPGCLSIYIRHRHRHIKGVLILDTYPVISCKGVSSSNQSASLMYLLRTATIPLHT